MKKRHTGIAQYRLKDHPTERIAADYWQKHGDGLLPYLLGGGERAEPSDRDWLVASTLFQWLGSPVGRAVVRYLGDAFKAREQKAQKRKAG